MKEKNEIIKKFKELSNELKKNNKYYFIDDNPKITDARYDELKKEFFLLERKYSFLKKLNLSKNIVG